MIGFMSDAEREFFDSICSVDGVGVKKALRAMVRPVRDVAIAIEEQDIKQLSALPGIGAALAERIIANLRRKMAKFALMIERDLPPELAADLGVFNDAYEALLMLGHTAPEARQRIEQIANGGMKFKSVEDGLEEIYRAQPKKGSFPRRHPGGFQLPIARAPSRPFRLPELTRFYRPTT